MGLGLLMLLILAEINKPAGGGGGEGEGAALPPLHEAVARGIRTRPRHEPAGGGAQVQPLPRQGAIKTQLGGGGRRDGEGSRLPPLRRDTSRCRPG